MTRKANNIMGEIVCWDKRSHRMIWYGIMVLYSVVGCSVGKDIWCFFLWYLAFFCTTWYYDGKMFDKISKDTVLFGIVDIQLYVSAVEQCVLRCIIGWRTNIVKQWWPVNPPAPLINNQDFQSPFLHSNQLFIHPRFVGSNHNPNKPLIKMYTDDFASARRNIIAMLFVYPSFCWEWTWYGLRKCSSIIPRDLIICHQPP